jgi:hypothetical protein
MLRALRLLFFLLVRSVSSRRSLLLENLALRQQLAVLARKQSRPHFTAPDKLFWVVMRQLWGGWHSALAIVQPETIVRWHRTGFKMYWKWISQHRARSGRKPVSKRADCFRL